jgi:probable DNA metabolism protein
LVSVAGEEELLTLYLVHAAGDPQVAGLLLRYLDLTLDAGRSIAADLNRAEVLAVTTIRDRVVHEINRFLGFVRFREVANGLYYSAIEPDADIAGFIGPHFVDRLPHQSFLIHDVGRRIGFWHDCSRRSWGMADLSVMPAALASALQRESEPAIGRLWRGYFDGIAIAQRKNSALQARNMPRRYWKHIVEVEHRPVPGSQRRPAR